MNPISEQLAYLLGLMTGRGHIYRDSMRIAIEFSHANKYVAKIVHCDSCGNLVTGFTVLKCKGCGKIHNKNEVEKLEQIESTKKSINELIIPYLKTSVEAIYSIVANPSMSLLVIDFSHNKKLFDDLIMQFPSAESFDAFHIPSLIKEAPRSSKIEFINGLLDTAGFNNAGGWLPRDGMNAHGRMRSYFQIVRNWYLPVEIDNFLREYFSLPIQTIDWGHPNIRDSSLKDYYESGKTSWSREHQIKFFPEYYKEFKFRIRHKQELFEDLIAHNDYAVFDRTEDWFPPGKVSERSLKAYHPGEDDIRIPEPARRHFDAFWQVNAAMGCEYIKSITSQAKNPKLFLMTGVDGDDDADAIEIRWHNIRKHITEEIHDKYRKKKLEEEYLPKRARALRTNPEQALYAPLTKWLANRMGKLDDGALAFDVSSGNLNQFIGRNKDLIEVFDYCNNYRIKPDIVGFLPSSKSISFIEAKVTSLSLKELGQLLGYCYVAQPIEAWLISDKAPSISLVRILQSHPALLEYMPGRLIKIGTWTGKDVSEVKL